MSTSTPRRHGGEREAEVLAILWSAGVEGVTPLELQEELVGDVAYTTALTLLTRLYEKKLVLRSSEGRSYRYFAATSEEELASRKMRALLSQVSDTHATLSQFASELTPRDRRALISELAKANDRHALKNKR